MGRSVLDYRKEDIENMDNRENMVIGKNSQEVGIGKNAQ